jgi:hypothetical protein
MGFTPVATSDVEELFRHFVLHGADTPIEFEGTCLPHLFGSAIRPLVNANEDVNIFINNNPVHECHQLFTSVYQNHITPGLLFRAALAGVPVTKEFLMDVFKNGVSLSTAYLRQVPNTPSSTTSDVCYMVDQPALAVTRSRHWRSSSC